MVDVYRKLIVYVPEKKAHVVLALLLSFGGVLLQAAAFFDLSLFLNKMIADGNTGEAGSYAVKIAVFLGSSGILYFLSLITAHVFAFRLETNLRKFGIEGLKKADFRFFDTNSSGQIRKKMDDNAAQTHMAVAHLLPDNTGALCMPLLAVGIGFTVSLRVGIILLLLLLISLVLVKRMVGRQEFMEIYKSSLEKLSAETVEYIRGMPVIKIFGVDIRNLKALNRSICEYANYAYRYSKSCKKPYVIFQMIFFGMGAVIVPFFLLLPGGNTDGNFRIVEMMMVYFLSSVMFLYIMKIMYIGMHLFNARDAVEKLEQLYASMHADGLCFGTDTEFETNDIEFCDVGFCYEKGKPVFEHLSFRLEGGRTYALVGESGSGKSTLAKLLSGFYRLNAGEIKIGGKPIGRYSQEALTSHVAFVFQNAKLFKKTIYENVALANPSADRSRVLEAMRLAGCESFLSKLQDRENTVIGSKGIFLSGGEKQRVAIARAILKDADIVIFDEASAAVDADHEHELQRALSNLMKGKTVIMIAHRLSSIRGADEILVLENGKLVERGSDEALMKEDSLYRHYQKTYETANDWRVIHEGIF